MQLPLQISFRNMDASDAVEAKIREKAAKLERFTDRIMACRVVVEAPNRRGHQGKLYHVRIDITTPGGEIVVNREAPENHAHEDVYVALRDAFNAAGRQLEDRHNRQRGKVKVHETSSHGKVARLFPDRDYGFILLADGGEVYFHRNSVIDGSFDDLAEGSEVRLTVDEKEGEKGPQASTVRPIGKHHLAG
ncbi:MAG: HPF/RaiA family ribosome-associated protein [Alphaproteobacteria bacterium]